MHAAFIAGCDGARSKVREVMGTGFPGGTYSQIFYVADVAGEGPPFNGDLNVDLDESDFLALFPLAHSGRVRLIGTIKPGHGKDLDELTFDDVSDRASQNLKLKVDKVNWFSVYHVHHRVTERFRQGRAFLLGDAAHIHTPVGGQGMNTGIGDAINLAWKLQAVLAGRAPDALLDTFEAERRAFALRLVQTTDRAFNFVAADGPLAEIVRTRVAPVILPQLVKFEAVREWIFRTVSQIAITYRGKGLDQGHAGPVHGGDRLPWVKVGDSDNYAALKRMVWQVHVYGTPGGRVAAMDRRPTSRAGGLSVERRDASGRTARKRSVPDPARHLCGACRTHPIRGRARAVFRQGGHQTLASAALPVTPPRCTASPHAPA